MYANIRYKLQVTSYKMKTPATCGFAFDIHHIANRTRYYLPQSLIPDP